MIPDYQTLMLPVLEYASDGKEHHIRDAIEFLANKFSLTQVERKELLPSGKQEIFNNRVHWAKTYLYKAGLLDSPKRGYFTITKKGRDILSQSPSRIDARFLRQFEEFEKFVGGSKVDKPDKRKEISIDFETITPEEMIETGFQKLQRNLAHDILEKVMESSPEFFEKLVVELIVNMGYGGSREDAGRAVGRSGDEGIDGIIKEDKLGLDIVYIQAKRWSNTVGRPEIQKFVGALQGQRARKGIFITTADFAGPAYDYVSKIDSKIVLIDGKKLAELMIEHNVGVSTINTYNAKRIDTDYFVED